MHLLYSATVHYSVNKMPTFTLSGTNSSHHISLRPILISCYRPSLHIHRDFSPSTFPIKIEYAALISRTRGSSRFV